MCTSVLSTFSFAQTPEFEWAKNLGGSGSQEIVSGVVVDQQGNSYTAGRFSGTVDFDPGPGTLNITSAGLFDVFVCKLNANGNLVWAKRIGGIGEEDAGSIAIDNSGHIYCAGYFSSTVDFDPGIGTFNLTSVVSGPDAFVVKFDTACNLVWAKKFGANLNDVCTAMAVDTFGNVYSSGFFNGTVDFDPGAGTFTLATASMDALFLSKLDSNGNFLWARALGGSAANSIALYGGTSVYVTGTFAGLYDFDPGAGSFTMNSGGSDNVFVLKLNSAGIFVWAKSMGGTGTDRGESSAIDGQGNIYLTGVFSGTADFDPGAGTYNLVSAGSWDIFVSKLDALGNLIWAKRLGGTGSDQGFGIALDDSVNVYSTGGFSGTVDFDPGAGTLSLSSTGNSDVYISKLDVNGNFLWAGAFGSVVNDYGNSIDIGINGAIFSAGDFSQTVDFDPSGNIYNITAVQGSDVFIHKMSQCTPPSNPINTTPTSNLTVCSGATTTLTATGSGTLGWYSSATGGTYLGGGNTFITPSLTGNAVYYVQDSTCAASASRTAVSVGVNNPSSSSLTQIACSSFTLNAQTYTVSGVYVQTIPNAVNCDSVITLNLTILSPSSFNQNITICDGQNLNVGSNTYSVTGTYSDTFIAANGCDSVVTTNLTVNPPIDTTVTFSGFTLTSNAVGASYQWIDCSSGLAIVGETNQTFTASANGNYAVGILSNGCTDTSACQTVIGLGDNFQNAHTYFLYPNPNNGTFILQTTSVSDVVIYDALGRTVYVEKVQPNVSVQISLPDSGLYLVNMTDMDGVQAVQRVIVNN